MLGLAGTAAQRETAARSLLALALRSDSFRLLAVLQRQRMVHLGIARLTDLGAEELVAQVASRLQPRLRAMRWRMVEQEMLTHTLVGTLEQHNVRAIPVKGAVLARRLFGDPGLRESEDIDLLVSCQQLEHAVVVLRERFAYSSPRGAQRVGGRPLLHYRLLHPAGLPTVELHWRLHWYEEGSGSAMVRRAVVDQGLAHLAPADELASLLLVYARDGFAGVRPLADLAAWWDQYSDQVPEGALAAFSREFPDLAPALAVAAWLAGTLAGVPAAKAGMLPYSADDRARRAIRLANWQLAGVNEQILADIAFVDLLFTPRTDLWRFIRRQILLPRDVAADRLVDAGSTRRELTIAAALHVPRILGRLVLAMLGTTGTRTRSALPSVGSGIVSSGC